MMHRLFVRLVTVAALLVPSLLSAQSVTTLPLSKSGFCRGEIVDVGYTVAGSFVTGNAFIVQVSDPTGSFATGFKNLKSTTSTSSGSIQVELPGDLPDGTGYRLRVIGSNPRVDGTDNGTDLSIQGHPYAAIGFKEGVGGLETVLINAPVTFGSEMYGAASFEWNFGSGASPATSTDVQPTVTYSTTGQKQISLTAVSPNGCSITRTLTVTVRETNPVIPATVRIVQGDETFGHDNIPDHLWVCPGGTCRIRESWREMPTVFVEAGGSVELGRLGEGILYMKSGSSLSLVDGPNDFSIIYEDGAGIPAGIGSSRQGKFLLPSLTFDYSSVPPGGCPSLAPYTVQIKQNANSIHTAQNDDRSNVDYWVRDGGALSSTGNGSVYCVEAGGHVTIDGSESKVYLKDGATADIRSGSGNRIFYEMQATIVHEGAEAVLLPSSGITFVNEVSSVWEEATAGGSLVEISPNPAVGEIEVRVDQSLGPIRQVTLYSILGEAVLEKKEVGSLTLRMSPADLPSGIYQVRVRTDRTELVRKLVIR